MSTPTSLELPDGVRRTTIGTARGAFAALEAVPGSGVCERDAALLVPGYTGSKEDFLAILHLLADDSRHVIAIDMRGQFETASAEDPAGYAAAALGADILAIMHETGARHLVGHSYGGLIGREAAGAGADWPVPGAEFGLVHADELRPRRADRAAGGGPAGDARCPRRRATAAARTDGGAERTAAGRTRPYSGPGSPSSGGRTWSRRPSRPESRAISSRSWAAGCWATTRTGWS